MIRRGIVLAVPALAFVARAEAQVLWLKVEGPERAFTFELPGTPDYKIQGGLHSYSLTRGPIEYVVQAVEVAEGDAAGVVQAAIDGTAPHLVDGRWQRIDRRQVHGSPAIEASGVLKNGNALRNLVVMKGRRLVSLGLRGPAGTTRFPDAERFFASLRFAS